MEIQKRSHAGVMTIGVLQITLGILGLICGLVSLSGGTEAWAKQQPTVAGQPSQAEIQAIMEQEIPHQAIFQKVNSGIDLLLSVLMIASGTGLVQMKNWGRQVANVYGVSSILYHIYTVIFTFMFLVPAMDAVGAKMAQGTAPGAAAAGGIMRVTGILTGVMAALFTLYPIAVLIVVNLKSAKEALSGVPTDTGTIPADYDDRDRGFTAEPDDRYRQPPDDRTQPM